MYKIKSLFEVTNDLYIKWIRKLVKYFMKYDLYMVAAVLPTLLAEPISAVRAAFLRFFGLKRNFNWYGCNPKSLHPEQAHVNPVLLIHGDFDQQSSWIKFAKELQKAGIPAFTINLPSRKFTSKDKDILEKKWTEIEKVYLEAGRGDVKIHVAGHSRGSTLAMMMGFQNQAWKVGSEGELIVEGHDNHRPNIGSIAMLGGYLDTPDKNEWASQAGIKPRIHEILGTHDIFLDVDTNFVPERRSLFECGHLNLLLNEEVHKKLITILKEKPL